MPTANRLLWLHRQRIAVEAPNRRRLMNTETRELRDEELDAVAGGFEIGSVCVLGYCASLSTDGLSVGPKGESYGTQAYNLVMKGMQKGLAAH
jgi:hypothetical protein